MRAADHLVDMGPGAGEHGGYVVAQGTADEVEQVPGVGDRAVPRGHARGSRCRRSGASRAATSAIEGATQHNLKDVDVAGPARRVLLRDRRVGLGQVDAGQRGPLQGGREPAAPARKQRPGAHRRDHRARPARQDHRRRPVADRPHAALQPGDVHRPVRPDPRAVLARRQEARARGYKPGRFSLQRQGRALRGLPRRRADQDRDALPARRLRAVRAVPRQALQPRDARGPLQGQERSPTCWRCRSRRRSSSSSTSRRSAGASRRCTTSGSTTCGSASRRRRCPAARRSA